MPRWASRSASRELTNRRTSGASVPEILVEGVLDYLSANGFADVQEYTEVKESMLFALPPELRRSMKAKAAGAPFS